MTETPAPEANDFNGTIIAEFRTNNGNVGGMFAGQNLLLLHHTGAKSGVQRVSPLGFQRVGESYAVFASKAGGPDNPDWFHNLRAHPDASVEVGTETFNVRARIPQPAERAVIWERQKERIHAYADYEKKAAPRTIPVVVLDPVK